MLCAALVLVLIFAVRSRKDPLPTDVADLAQQILNGTSAGWDIDDYEHLHPREPRLAALWKETMNVGGLPEEWIKLDDSAKLNLQKIIQEIRELIR